MPVVGGGGSGGTPGTTGASGLSVLETTGPPATSLGRNGEWAIDPSAKMFYGPKSAGTWPSGFSIVGPRGDIGPEGSGGGSELDPEAIPSIEDVGFHGRYDSSTISATNSYIPLGVIGASGLRIAWVALTWSLGAAIPVGNNATLHWKFEIGKYVDADATPTGGLTTFYPIASKITYGQTGGGIAGYLLGETPRTGRAWTVTLNYDEDVNQLQYRDTLFARWTKVGGEPGNMSKIDYSYQLVEL